MARAHRVARVISAVALSVWALSANGARAQDRAWPHAGIRPAVFEAAMSAFRSHASELHNDRFLTIVDYGLPSNRPRLYVLDRDSGTVASYLVAHGKGSDPDHTGRATYFSNQPGSEASSIGAYLTGDTYVGEHGESLRLIGLDSTNSNAADRAIVLHGAQYVAPSLKVLGRSWGCPAVEQRFVQPIIDHIRSGSLLFIYG